MLDLASCAFRAMGTDVNVLVLDGEDADLQWAHGEIERLEALWSRFQEQSEVSPAEPCPRVLGGRGAGDGRPAGGRGGGVGSHRWRLRSLAGRGAGGPRLRPDLRSDRPDERGVDAPTRAGPTTARRPRGGCLTGPGTSGRGPGASISGVSPRAGPQTTSSPDSAAAARRVPAPTSAATWPWPGRAPRRRGLVRRRGPRRRTMPPGMLAVRQGGVATSTRLRRRWRGPGGDDRHHLLDPQGRPCTGPVVEVTAVAGLAARAEVLTKLAFVAPDRIREALRDGEAALLTTTDGATAAVGALHLVQPIARSVDVAG